MIKDNLLELKNLLPLLGYTDLRSVKSWLIKNKLPILPIGKKLYTLSTSIEEVINRQITQNVPQEDSGINQDMNNKVGDRAPSKSKLVRSKSAEQFLKNIE